MKRLFLMAMTAMMFTACSKESGDPPSPNNGESAYISIKLSAPVDRQSAPAARATNSEVEGSVSESTMNTATVLLFDDNDLCLGSVEFTSNFSSGTSGTSGTFDAKAVPAKTKKIFVVVNKLDAKWDLASAVVEGKSWSSINTYMAITAAEISATSNFLMTNTGTLADGALQTVTVYEKAGDAKAAPAEVIVDRVTSKVIVKTANSITTPTGATFEFQGWELNTTNKQTSLYSERVPFTGATIAVPGIYRRDNNYLKADFGASETDITTYIKENYNWLKNGPASTDISAVSRPAYVSDAATADGVAYCTENTMDANAQLWGHTTKVVVKGKYTPAGITAGESYFAYKSVYYSVGNLKTEYKKTDKTDLKADLIAFLSAAFPSGYGSMAEEEKNKENNINTAIDALGEYSGILAKYKAVTYYHNSVCYYDALINHDQSNADKMALGRYGVVRNNAYELTINSVKGPGTPWIPDPTDPDDPTDPTDPDDEVEANLSVDVKLKKWTLWTQGVDLGR